MCGTMDHPINKRLQYQTTKKWRENLKQKIYSNSNVTNDAFESYEYLLRILMRILRIYYSNVTN